MMLKFYDVHVHIMKSNLIHVIFKVVYLNQLNCDLAMNESKPTITNTSGTLNSLWYKFSL